jgi:ligand-binding sensor domain-containing protein/signal transduction histidine kinase
MFPPESLGDSGYPTIGPPMPILYDFPRVENRRLRSHLACSLVFVLGIFSCILASSLAGGLPAQSTEFNTQLWQTEDGLPHSIVQAIAQSQDGYLWVGTREGLARFDGVRFEALELIPGTSSESIFCLLESRDGSLWVGTEQFGAFRLHEGRIERCFAPDGTANYAVSEIHEGGDGTIWIGSSLGILHWVNGKMEERGKFKSLRQSMCVDPRGAVWLFGDGPLHRVDDPANTHEVHPTGTLPKAIRRIYCDRDGVFWLASNDRLYRIQDGVATSFQKAEGPSGLVGVIFQDHEGGHWIGTYAGLSRFVNDAFVDQDRPHEPSYRVFAIFEDREQNLWIGSEEGLARMNPKRFKTLTKKDGLSLNTVVSVCASREGGVWIGAWGGGINRWQDGKLTYLNKGSGLSSDFVMAILESRDGSLWVGADYASPLNRIKDGQITQYGRPQGFAASVTSALYEDDHGTVWIGSRESLQSWNGSQFRLYTANDGFSQNKVNALCGGASGVVWIGTEEGLVRWIEGNFENLAASHPRLQVPILSLYEDTENVLWIGTRGRGLLHWKNGVLNEFTSRQGLFSDSIYSIVEDHQANLWLNSARGIFRIERKAINMTIEGRRTGVTSVSYGKADGILSSGQYREVTQPAACRSDDGRLWFRTTQGVVVVNPAEITSNQVPPPVVIQEIIADKQSVALSGSSASQEVKVRPGRGELQIEYASLSFRAPEKNQYRYKLEGVDSNWVEAGTRRIAHYNNLHPGHYRLQVMASNNDAVWNEAGVSVPLFLQPHFWQTWWFLSLIGVSTAGMLVTTSRYITQRRMRRKLERLEQQNALENERARIARDMHDELGARLTSISFRGAMALRNLSDPVEAERQIVKMSETARELVSSLDQIVWAVDPENDTLDSLANYLCRYTSQFLENTPLQCAFVIPPKLPDCRLSTEVRHNVFLAVKEILNNVVKHSGAKRVTLGITVRVGEFEVSVSDDGCGINAEENGEPGRMKRTGRGLANLRERLASIRGRFELCSEGGSGVHVRLIVPLGANDVHVSYNHPTRSPSF